MSLTGQWKDLKEWLTSLPSRLMKVSDEIEDEILQEAAAEARREILANEIVPPSKGGKGITLIESGTYVKSIGVYRNAEGIKYVGFPPEGVHRPSGLEWHKLWRYLRYGTARMPARPHIDTAMAKAYKKLPLKFKLRGFNLTKRVGAGYGPGKNAGPK